MKATISSAPSHGDCGSLPPIATRPSRTRARVSIPCARLRCLYHWNAVRTASATNAALVRSWAMVAAWIMACLVLGRSSGLLDPARYRTRHFSRGDPRLDQVLHRSEGHALPDHSGLAVVRQDHDRRRADARLVEHHHQLESAPIREEHVEQHDVWR